MEDFTESTSPHDPFYTINPENFRRTIQRSIDRAVSREVDGLFRFTRGNRSSMDGRYYSSFPSVTQAMSNAHGYQYFIVGSSVVGRQQVAAP